MDLPGIPDEEEAPDPRRPSAWRSFRRAVGITYDYLGTSLAASFASFLLVVGALVLATPLSLAIGPAGLALAAVLALLILAADTAGLFHLAGKLLARDDPSVLDVWAGIRQGGGDFLRIILLDAALGGVLVANLAFYLSRPSPVAKLVAVPVLYALGFLLLVLLYQPALAHRQRTGPVLALRRGALLVLDNPAYTALLGLLAGAVTVGCVVAVLPLALIWPAFMATLSMAAVEDLLRKYEEPEE